MDQGSPPPASRRLAVVIVFLALTLAVVYAAFAYLYRGYRNQLDAELGHRLVAVAATTGASVGGEVWDRLAAGDAIASGRLRRDLEAVRKDTGVSNIFLFDPDGVTRFDLAGRYAIGEVNLALDFDLVEVTAALSGLPEYTELTEYGGAFLKTGYAPIHDDSARVVGGVGVEASAAFLDLLDSVRGTLIGAAAVVLAGVVLLGAGFARLLASEAALERRLRRSETLATMGQMAAMLAHEIRNPLGIIRGAAERVGAAHGIQSDEVLRFIPEEVDRLEATLGAYLDFARARGTGEGEDAADALRGTLDLIAEEWTRKGIEVDVDIEEGAFPVRAEGHFLRQAFLNVLLNARDAMPSGGRLAVRLRRADGRAVVAFADSGEGMTEDVRRRATEPFFTSKEKGSGLGLAVVRRVVTEAGGRIDIRSRKGAGTTVELAFPLAIDGRTR